MEATKAHPDDYQLVHHYLCGDTAAGQYLYTKSIPMLEKYIQKNAAKGGFTSHDVNEILSETLKRSVEKLSQFNRSGKFTTWIIEIAKYVMLEEFRNKKKCVAADDIENIIELDFYRDNSFYNQDPLKIVIRKEMVDDVKNALACLSQEHRDVIEFRFIRKIPAKVVAQMLGESVDAINSRYLRAMRAWRKNIKEKF